MSEKVGGLERQDKIAEEQETEAEPVSSTIDLTSWKRDDIVKIMAKYDTDFTDAKWFTFIYREDKHYYDQVGPIFGEDLFYDIRYKDRGDELTVNRFRMFNLGSGNKTIATGVYENDYLPLISKAQLINSDLVCVNEIECGGIKVIKCTKEDNKHYSWFAAPYLFTGFNDSGRSLTAFKSFYCE